jgi:hypothetical protein
MTLRELLQHLRFLLDDAASPPQWPDEALIVYLNEAEREAARRSLLLVDLDRRLPLSPGIAEYTLPVRPLVFRRLTLATSGCGLRPISEEDLDTIYGHHWPIMVGCPRAMIRRTTDRIRLFPIPAIADMLIMDLYRLPLRLMADPQDEPEIPAEYHLALLHWAVFRAFSTGDPDLASASRAHDAEAAFERCFGRQLTALQDEQRHAAGRRTVRYQDA